MSQRYFRDDLEPGDHARSYFEAALTRVVAGLAFMGALAAFDWSGVFEISLGPVVAMTLAQCVVIVGTFPWTLESRRLAFAGVLFDLVCQTIVFWLLGPARMIVVLLIYVFGLIKTGLRLTRRGYFVVANCASLFFGIVIVLETRGIIPIFHDNGMSLTPLQNEATAIIVWLSMNIAAIYVASFDEYHDERARALADAKAELTQHSLLLEEKVRERTAEIGRANEQLGEKNRELELYASAVSHDLRSPMVAAGEGLRVARSAVTDAARERCLDLASDNLDRADRMLVGLRDLMRTVGAHEPPGTVSVRGLVEDVIRDLQSFHGGAPLPVQLVGELGSVRAQGAKLQHVFRNLIANALEHGGGEVRVEVGREDGDGEASFFVRDDGAGIPYDYQARIFEPYRRGPTGAGGGMGLGLALVAQIVAEHGGRAWVQSEPGAGATFRFTLPNCEDEERTS